MSEEYHHPKFDFGPLLLGLFGILCGAVIVAAFHYITMGWCGRRNSRLPSRGAQLPQHNQDVSTPNSVNSSSTDLRNVYLYKKEWKEGTCAVCLSEFVEGEEIRVLPDCAHAFHVPCIDMWVYSHPNCPLCRTATMTHVVISLPSSGELPPPVESLPSSREFPNQLQSLQSSVGLPSPTHNRVSREGTM